MKNDFDLKGYMKSNKLGAYQQLNEMWYSDLQAIGQPMGMRHTAINEEEAVEEQQMEEGKKQLAFVIPCPDCYDIDEEAEHFQYLLDKAGVKAKAKANMVGEEVEVYTKDEKKARKVIEKNGYQIGWNDEVEDNGQGEPTQSDDQEQSHYLDIPTGPDKGWKNEMAGDNVKSLGAGKMAHANTRVNLGRHRSSDTLDKQVAKDHDKNTIKGAKAAAYKPPYMKEEETADDIFAGSDTANWNDRGNHTADWDLDFVGKQVGNWKSDIEQQAGSISWTSEKYPNAIIYATPGWEGVDGIAVEVHESEDGLMDEPILQKVVGSGTDLWKTEKGYMALMAKIFNTLEKMLTPSDNMDEDHGRQIDHDKNDNISKDPSEFEDTVYEGIQDYNHTFEEDIMDLLDDGVSKPEILTHFKDILKNANPRMEESIEDDEDPFGSIKTGIDKITQGDDEDMSDEDRIMSMGGDQIKAGIQSLLDDGFDYRQILDLVKNAIKATRKGGVN